MDRMDRPKVDKVEGVPPAIAIDQTNPVRNSRSTVGTMTEINDHLKMLFSQASSLYCRCCGRPVREESPQDIWEDIAERLENVSPDARLSVCFHNARPSLSSSQKRPLPVWRLRGFTRCTVVSQDKTNGSDIEVIADRFKPSVPLQPRR